MWKLVCLALVLGLSLPSADADALSCDYCSVYNTVKNNHDYFNGLVQKLLVLSPLDLSLNLDLGLIGVHLKKLAFDSFYVSLYSNAQGVTVIRIYFDGSLSLDVDVPLLGALGALLPSTKAVTVDGYLTLYIDVIVTVTSSGQVQYVNGDALIQGSGELDIKALQLVNLNVKGAIFFPIALQITTKITEKDGLCDQYVESFNSAGNELCIAGVLCAA
ncbi:uncharacterized protein LOC142466618 [Ascaphus truei]|uniref:uncharacterized protein LOC142466618 n=1 Tax=Ascaphus truei TaxID=8439 RepID=UPI003F590759